jgi:arginine deiminase
MHIDTIFTQINHNHVVAYKPYVIDGLGSSVTVFRDNGQAKGYKTIA